MPDYRQGEMFPEAVPQESGAPVRLRNVREKSSNERNAKHQPWGHKLVFCFHDRSIFVPCTACKRTQRDSEENFARFRAKYGGA